MKAADIPDAVFLEQVRKQNDGELADLRDGALQPRWAFVWDVAEQLGVPGKVAEAKAAKLIKRGLMDGCDAKHWCRGDYEITDAGRRYLDVATTPEQAVAAIGRLAK